MGRPLTACACILAAVALFVLNSELMQAESAAVPPFFMIWLCHSGQALFVPLAPATPPPTAASAAPTALLRPVSRAAFALSVGTMTCNYLFVLALGMASVTVVNAIYMGSIGPTYLLSIALLGERPRAPKQLAVAVVLVGIGLMAADGPPEGGEGGAVGGAVGSSRAGVAVAVLSSMVAACQKVLFKRLVGEAASPAETLRVLGCIGLCHLLCLWPGMLLLHVTRLEPFSLPAAGDARGLCVTVALALCVNLLSTHALFLTGPVFSSAGFALTIPASALADAALHDGKITTTQLGGMCSILVGFVAMACMSDGGAPPATTELKQSAA